MPRSPAPARARRKAPDKAPAARAAAPRRKASTSQAVAVAPPVAEVSEGSPQASRARNRAKAPAPTAGRHQASPRAAKVAGKTSAKPATRKKAVASDAPQPPVKSVAASDDAQTVTAAAPAPRRARRRESTAEVLDALDQGFVPKAPPPTAPAHAKPGEPALHEHPGVSVEAPPLGARLSPIVSTRLATTEPAAQPRYDPPASIAAAPPPPLTAAPVRLRCPGCDYPLARQARFCRRCGVAQRPNGTLPLVSEQRITPADAPWAQSVLRPAAESEQTDVESKSKHVEIKSLQIDGESKQLDAERLNVEGKSPRVEVPSQQPVVASPALETAIPRLACVACGMPLLGSARFCRSCDGSEKDSTPAQNIQAITPVQAESTAGHDSTPVVAASIRCHACGESLPGVARFCMFCAAPQAVERALVPQPAPSDSSHAGVEAVVDQESHPGDSPGSSDEVSQGAPEPTYAVEAVPVDAVPVEAESSEHAPPQAAEASAPPPIAEPAPLAETITLLEPDVVERLTRARDEIDEIGRSIDGLARTLTANNATAKRPSALPPRRR